MHIFKGEQITGQIKKKKMILPGVLLNYVYPVECPQVTIHSPYSSLVFSYKPVFYC